MSEIILEGLLVAYYLKQASPVPCLKGFVPAADIGLGQPGLLYTDVWVAEVNGLNSAQCSKFQILGQAEVVANKRRGLPARVLYSWGHCHLGESKCLEIQRLCGGAVGPSHMSLCYTKQDLQFPYNLNLPFVSLLGPLFL